MCRFTRTTLFAAALFPIACDTVWSQQIILKGGMAIKQAAVADAPAKQSSDVKVVNADETLLRSFGIATDGPGLLAFFRTRGRGEATPERLAELIEQLNDPSLVKAQKAGGDLAALGAPAIPALRQATKDPDRQQGALLARRCLRVLEEQPGRLTSAAARLLAQLKPPGTVEALLAFLPVAEDDSVMEEVRAALAAVAYSNGKPDPSLLLALRDESSIRRALAIDTLCQNGYRAELSEQVPVRKLLHDPKPLVRLRAALVLARARDAEALSPLIDLLSALPLDQARQAEDFLNELAGEQAPKAALTGDAAARQKCRDAWATWWKKSEDGAKLLDELRKRTVTEEVRGKCEKLIGQLGDADFSVRQKAQAEVKAMGARIVPLLRLAARHADLEVRKRARDCLSELERDKNVPLSPLVPRLVALRKPVGASEALLAFTPYADDETMQSEVQLALNVTALSDGKPDPVVIRALTDPIGARQAAAAEALCLGGDRARLPAIRQLLRASDPLVRLKVALALAGAREREAVPTLIQLLGELPALQSEPAEEYLRRLASEQSPNNLPAGDSVAERKKRQTIWAEWWKTNGERVALVDRYPAAGSERAHGFILLVLSNSGQIQELGVDRKVRWELNGLSNPRDVQVLGTDRILVAEYNGQGITERNRRGEILWQKKLPGAWPLGAQRLRNGHTFITCQNKLVEVDRAGNELYSIARPQSDVVMARRMRDGQIILVSTMRQCIRMDTTGKQLKSFPIQMVWQNGVDILPNGHVLVPVQWMNRITEYDAEGKVVFDVNSMQPSAATRLPKGNVLAAPQVWPAKIQELDAAGKQVSEFTAPNFVWRIRTR